MASRLTSRDTNPIASVLSKFSSPNGSNVFKWSNCLTMSNWSHSEWLITTVSHNQCLVVNWFQSFMVINSSTTHNFHGESVKSPCFIPPRSFCRRCLQPRDLPPVAPYNLHRSAVLQAPGSEKPKTRRGEDLLTRPNQHEPRIPRINFQHLSTFCFARKLAKYNNLKP